MARFLVVDDDHSCVVGLSLLLRADGHEVSPHTRGASAVEALMSESFDAILTDLEMPVVDGNTVVHVTRQTQPKACLVVITSRAATEHETLVKAGACIVADKPVDYETVAQSVRDCRLRTGPGAHGHCHMQSEDRNAFLRVRF